LPLSSAAPPRHYSTMACLPADEAAVFALLKSPPPPLDKKTIVKMVVKERRFGVLQRAVEGGVLDPNFELPPLLLLTHVAAGYGAAPLLRSLISRGVDPNEKDSSGWAPLPLAVSMKQKEAALFLINNVPGADLNAQDEEGFTPLMFAAGTGMLAVMKALIAKGADVNAVNQKQESALIIAMANEQEEAALYLVEQARATWDMGGEERTPLAFAAKSGQVRSLKAILRRMRAEILGNEAAVFAHMESAAAVAVDARELASLQALVEEGLDVTRVRREKGTPGGKLTRGILHLAAEAGDIEVVQFLIAQGCNSLEPDSSGALPYHVAAIHGHLDLLKWLVTRFAIPLDAKVIPPLRWQLVMANWTW
jgi:ankyrin repeat protein